MKKNFWKNKLGYTLGEIVMTTAIIGSLAAIAVPNFLRIKMNVNMELVKQQLRILGQNMNELYNQNNPHQYPEDILNLDGNPAEELAITASLNAINGMGYEITHLTATGGTDFTDRADPMPGMDGISGDKCLIVDSSGIVREINCWSGEGVFTSVLEGSLINQAVFKAILTDPLLSEAQKMKILAGMFIQMGLFLEYTYGKTYGDVPLTIQIPDPDSPTTGRGAQFIEKSALPSFLNYIYSEDKAAFDQLAQKAALYLEKEYGIHVYINSNEGANDELGNNFSTLDIAVKFDTEPDDPFTYSNADTTAYKNYVSGVPAFQEHYNLGPWPGALYGAFSVSQEGTYSCDPCVDPNSV